MSKKKKKRQEALSRKFQEKLIFWASSGDSIFCEAQTEASKPRGTLISSISSYGKDVHSEPSNFHCTSNPHNDMDNLFFLLLLS